LPRTNPTYPPEFRREAIRLVRASDEDHPIPGIAREIGVSDGTLRNWVNQDEIDSGQREGLTTEEKEELRKLRREVRTLRQEKEILRKASGGFNRSVQHDRFSVLSGLEVHEWRDWVVLEGCRRRVRRSCGSGGGPGSP